MWKDNFVENDKRYRETYLGSIETNGLNIAYIFQEPRLMPWLNVFDNVTFGLEKKT